MKLQFRLPAGGSHVRVGFECLILRPKGGEVAPAIVIFDLTMLTVPGIITLEEQLMLRLLCDTRAFAIVRLEIVDEVLSKNLTEIFNPSTCGVGSVVICLL